MKGFKRVSPGVYQNAKGQQRMPQRGYMGPQRPPAPQGMQGQPAPRPMMPPGVMPGFQGQPAPRPMPQGWQQPPMQPMPRPMMPQAQLLPQMMPGAQMPQGPGIQQALGQLGMQQQQVQPSVLARQMKPSRATPIAPQGILSKPPQVG